jgi:hypothetical protein
MHRAAERRASMARVIGGRITVRAEGDPTLRTLYVSAQEQPDGTTKQICKLATGDECEPIDSGSWRIRGTDQVLYRVDPPVEPDQSVPGFWPTPRPSGG